MGKKLSWFLAFIILVLCFYAFEKRASIVVNITSVNEVIGAINGENEVMRIELERISKEQDILRDDLSKLENEKQLQLQENESEEDEQEQDESNLVEEEFHKEFQNENQWQDEDENENENEEDEEEDEEEYKFNLQEGNEDEESDDDEEEEIEEENQEYKFYSIEDLKNRENLIELFSTSDHPYLIELFKMIKSPDITACEKLNKTITLTHKYNAWSYVQTSNQGCEKSCYLTDDIQTADVVYFHGPSYYPPERRFSEQKLVGFGMEPRQTFGSPLWEDSYLAQTDLSMTYKFDSNILVSYLEPHLLTIAHTRPIPTPEEFYQKKFGVWIQRNCDVEYRTEKLRELISYLPIESRGYCLNNAPVVQGHHSILAPTYSQYKFVFAFESQFDEDYVSEKFFRPIEAGSIPIYWGSDTVYLYAPSKNSFIDARNFPNMRALADYLTELDKDYDKYIEYFQWKTNPLPSKVPILEYFAAENPDTMCRVCACLCDENCSSKPTSSGQGILSLLNQIIQEHQF